MSEMDFFVSDQTDAVRILVKHGADVNNTQIDGLQPIHYAAYRGSLIDLKRLGNKYFMLNFNSTFL